MNDPLRDRLRRYQELADKATPGPWHLEQDLEWYTWEVRQSDPTADLIVTLPEKEDAGFIAASRTEGPALAKALEAVLALCDYANNVRISPDEIRDTVSQAMDSERKGHP